MASSWQIQTLSSWKRGGLICGLRIANGSRVFLGEEGHSDSDFLLIFSDNCLQNGNEILLLLGVCLGGYVAAELAQQIDVIHECGSPSTQDIFLQGEGEGNTGISVLYRTEVLVRSGRTLIVNPGCRPVPLWDF
jgi:hypothetical protein